MIIWAIEFQTWMYGQDSYNNFGPFSLYIWFDVHHVWGSIEKCCFIQFWDICCPLGFLWSTPYPLYKILLVNSYSLVNLSIICTLLSKLSFNIFCLFVYLKAIYTHPFKLVNRSVRYWFVRKKLIAYLVVSWHDFPYSF